MAGAHIRCNGIRQHYLHFSSGEPRGPSVLIVPGIVSPAALWSHVGLWLAETRDCYILDGRGRGLSEAGEHLDYGLDACAQDVVAFFRAKRLGPVVLVGHSMGARILLRAARQPIEGAESLVLVDPPTSGPGRRPYPVPQARTLGLLRAARRGEGEQALRQSPGAAWPHELQRLRAEWLPTCDERAVYAAYEDFHQQDLFADLAAATVPPHLICAGEGGVVSIEDVDEMRALRPDLTVARLADTGHQMQAENFDGFRALLAAAIDRRAPTPHPNGS